MCYLSSLTKPILVVIRIKVGIHIYNPIQIIIFLITIIVVIIITSNIIKPVGVEPFWWLLHSLCRVILNLLISQVLLSFLGSFVDLVLVKVLVVRPQRALAVHGVGTLSVEMCVVVGDRFSANVAHGGTTGALHLVAAVLFEELLLTRDAAPQHGLGHGVLESHSVRHVPVFLHFIAGERYVTVLLAETARLLATLGVSTPNNLVMGVGHDGG